MSDGYDSGNTIGQYYASTEENSANFRPTVGNKFDLKVEKNVKFKAWYHCQCVLSSHFDSVSQFNRLDNVSGDSEVFVTD